MNMSEDISWYLRISEINRYSIYRIDSQDCQEVSGQAKGDNKRKRQILDIVENTGILYIFNSENIK